MIVAGVVLDQALADFPTQVQAREARVFLLEFLDDPEALPVVLEAAVFLHQTGEDHLTFVTEG